MSWRAIGKIGRIVQARDRAQPLERLRSLSLEPRLQCQSACLHEAEPRRGIVSNQQLRAAELEAQQALLGYVAYGGVEGRTVRQVAHSPGERCGRFGVASGGPLPTAAQSRPRAAGRQRGRWPTRRRDRAMAVRSQECRPARSASAVPARAPALPGPPHRGRSPRSHRTKHAQLRDRESRLRPDWPRVRKTSERTRGDAARSAARRNSLVATVTIAVDNCRDGLRGVRLSRDVVCTLRLGATQYVGGSAVGFVNPARQPKASEAPCSAATRRNERRRFARHSKRLVEGAHRPVVAGQHLERACACDPGIDARERIRRVASHSGERGGGFARAVVAIGEICR